MNIASPPPAVPASPAAEVADTPLIQRVCPACGDANAQTPVTRYSDSRWPMKTCRACRMVYLVQAPDYAALFESHAWERTSKAEEQRRAAIRPVSYRLSKATRWRMRLFPRKTMPALLAAHATSGRVIDLGCGDGGQMEGLESRFIPHGVEISTALARTAQERFAARGGHCINDSSLDGLKQCDAAFFSAATLRSYLEHELHPAEVLSELHRTLAPNGIAIVKVPNYGCLNRQVTGAKWCGFRFPDHLNYFTPATLRSLAARAGFDTWFAPTWRLPTSDNMWAILKKT